MDDKIDILESFLVHPGWSLLEANLLKEWGRMSEQYISALERSNPQTHNELVSCARLAAAILAWPKEELKRARIQRTNETATTRHDLLSFPAGTHRGGW